MSTPEPAPASRGGLERWLVEHRTAADVLLALALAVVLGALTLSGASGVDWSAGWLSALVVAFVVLHASVAFRTHAPAPAYALASLAMLAVALVPDARIPHPSAGTPDRMSALVLPSSLVFLVLLFTAASRLRPRLALGALAVALAGAILAAVRMSGTLASVAGKDWLAAFYTGAGLVITVLLTWWLGRLTAARRARAIAERQDLAQAAVRSERARIAREMHDIVAHSLAVIVRQAEGGAYVADSRPDQAAAALATIAHTGRRALTDMRGLLGVLRDPQAGDDPGPQPGLADIPALVAGTRQAGLAVEVSERGERFALGAAAELAAYRVVQEGLTNVVKHAGTGAAVAVAFDWQGAECALAISDDGGAQAPATAVPGAGAGLQGLRERCAAVGAAFSAGPDGPGFRIRAVFPAPDGAGT